MKPENKIAEPLKIKVDGNSEYKELLSFIADTQEGKFTDQKPDLVQVTYKRLQVPEQDIAVLVDDENNNILLFGVSY